MKLFFLKKRDRNIAFSLSKTFIFFLKGDIDMLVKSAKNVASAANFTVSNIAEPLRNISQEVDKTEITKGKSDLLNDAVQTGEFVL